MRALRRRREAGNTGSSADDPDGKHIARARLNPRAFEPLFDRYWDDIVRFCYYRLESWEDAEDAASQIFTNAYAALERFCDDRDSFRSWLYTIAHHEVANRRRYRLRHPEGSLESVSALIDSSPMPDELLVAASAYREIRTLMARLPERPRRVTELRLAGLSDREISQVLGVSNDAVRKAQSRAVAHLRALMGIDVAEKETTDA
jgi:RNA polymerase sigma-70 factor (ECF subfamily)